MLYISPEDRSDLDPISTREALTADELAYQITCLADGFLAGNVEALTEAVGAMECAKQELYRRIAAAHADRQRAAHGDVYVTRP